MYGKQPKHRKMEEIEKPMKKAKIGRPKVMKSKKMKGKK